MFCEVRAAEVLPPNALLSDVVELSVLIDPMLLSSILLVHGTASATATEKFLTAEICLPGAISAGSDATFAAFLSLIDRRFDLAVSLFCHVNFRFSNPFDLLLLRVQYRLDNGER